MFVEIDNKFNLLNNIFSLVSILDNKILLPKNVCKFKTKKQEKVFQNLNSVIELYNINKLVFEKRIKNKISNYFYKCNNKLGEINNVKLDKYILKIIEYIIEKKNLTQDTAIAILVNHFNSDIIENILELSIRYKHLTIVTKSLNRGIKLQDEIFDKYGIMLKVSNNKRKGLKDSSLIINIDVDNLSFNNYVILDNAIVMNINQKVKIKSLRFSGLNLSKIVFGLYTKKKEEIEQKYNIDCNKYDVEDLDIKEIIIEKIFSENGFL